MERLCDEQDGFVVAEQDREERGDEALLGDRREELPSFPVADTFRDRELLLRARRSAIRVLQQDPRLQQVAHSTLRDAVIHRYGDLAGHFAKKKSRRRRRRHRN